MIHVCSVCSSYFCHDCLITSSKPITITVYRVDLEEDVSEEWTKSICKECMAQFK